MDAVWGAVLSFLFVVATLSGYGAGTPPDLSDKEKSEQSEKKDDDKDKKEESDKKDESSKDKSGKSDKLDKKDQSGQKGKSSPAKASSKKAEYCIKDCPETWRIRP